MIQLTISNQRGGVGKTTTAVTLARCFADKGMRVLLFDTDSQGSIAAVLGLKPTAVLYDLLIQKLAFRECIVEAHQNIDVICSNRYTVEAESAIAAAAASANAQAAESRAAVHGEAANAKVFEPSPELKSFYREVAKRAHPDLATDEADRQNREKYMKRANQAYEQGNEEELKRILAEYDSSPDSVKGTGVAADLVRVIRQIKQIKNHLTQIESGWVSTSLR